MPGRVAQSVGHLTRKSGVLGSIPGQATYFRFSFRWRKYVHEVLVNRLRGLSIPRKSVVRLTDRPNMTLDIYRGRKTIKQQQEIKVSSSGCHSAKVLSTTDGCFLVAMVSNLCRHHIYNSRGAWHTLYAILLSNYK